MNLWDTGIRIMLPALVTLLGVYMKFGHRRIIRALERRRVRDANIACIPDVLEAIRQVQAELKTNGGRSLRDEIRRIGNQSAVTEQQLRAIMQSDTSQAVFETNA